MLDAGVKWAIEALDTLDSEDTLTPVHRLELSFRYKIKDWILSAVSGLVDRQEGRKLLRLISNDDVKQMGTCSFILIVKGIEAIQAARTSVAINPPGTHHCPQCRLHQQEQICTRVWQDFWYTTIPHAILAPNQPLSLLSLVAFLQKAKINNLRDTCKSLTLFHFEKTDVLKVETSVKDRLASAIWELHQEGRM